MKMYRINNSGSLFVIQKKSLFGWFDCDCFGCIDWGQEYKVKFYHAYEEADKALKRWS